MGERHLIGHDTPERRAGFFGAGIALATLVALVLLAFAVGRFPISPADLGRLLWAAVTGAPPELPDAMATVVFRVRGPRILTALVVGAALAAAGAAYQGLFRNPLVSPDILGASAGAALGAVLGIYGSFGVAAIQGLAFALGLFAVALTYAIGASLRHPDPVLVLVLAGIVIGTLFGSGVALMKYLADPYNQLPAMTFWLLGSLAGVTPADLGAILPAVMGGLVPLVLLRWRINVMTLGEEEARALGADTRWIRLAVVAAATLMTAAVVSVSGVIGWIGLLVPHLARFLVGADFRRLLPWPCCGRRLPARHRYSRAHSSAHRDPPRGAHRAHRHPALHLAAGHHATVVMTLEIRDLAFGYAGRPIGRDVDFGVSAGEVLCSLSQRQRETTLFKTLLGLLEPLGGSVVVDGRPTQRWSRRERARVFGYVPQAQPAVFTFTVLDLVLMGRTADLGLFSSPGLRDHEIARSALTVLGIDGLARRSYGALSGGERQLTLVARAIAQEPRILVLDEPTANLDFGNQVRVLSAIRELATRGLAVVFSTHDPDQAFLCAHRVGLLHGGRLVGLGAPHEVITREQLRAVYGVDVSVVTVDIGRDASGIVCIPSLADDLTMRG